MNKNENNTTTETNKNNQNDEKAEDEIVSVGLKATNFNNLIDRFFTKVYLNKNTPEEQYVFIHSNGIVICGLGENNKIIKQKLKALLL